jgi:hypothetical protein
VPNARRIIFGTYVAPTKSDTMEEDSISKTTFLGSTSDASLNKTLGAKGSATIDTAQWNDGWTSMSSSQIKWEDLDDDTDATGNRWEDFYDRWGVVLTLTTAGIQIASAAIVDCGFLYVKNIGTAKNALISLNGDNDYYIIIPPGGSVCLRGTTDLESREVWAKASHSDGTDIEYIIAQLTP